MAASKTPAGEKVEEALDIEALLASPAEKLGPDHRTPEEEEQNDMAGELAAAAPGAQAISATCKRDFTAVHESGKRDVDTIRLIVIHSTESSSARSSASWFANPASAGSAHLLVDDRECYRTLDNDEIPWGAPGANTMGFHIEHAGFAKWTRAQWLQHEDTLKRGAFKSALHARRFGIPFKWLTADDLRHGRSGFVTHAVVSEFNPAGNHTDPGPNFPRDHYMALVKQFAAEMDV